jgi:uncharacterized protein
LFCATALSGLLAPTAAADAGTQQPASPWRAGFVGSRLMPPKPESRCRPEIGPLYRASAIVTGTDLRQRPWGFAETLREVLVKSSGDPRLKGDARTARLAAHAESFVACFSYADLMAGIPLHDDQGTYDRPYRLTVYFIPARIDAALAQLGDRPWRGTRPVIVPVLRVHDRKSPPYMLSAEIGAGEEERGSFAVAADEFGIKARIPSDRELIAWHASVAHLPRMPTASSAGEAIVVGTLDWSEALPGWIGKWRMRWHGVDLAWGISGVNYDAAFRNLVRGVALVASGAGAPDQGS